MNAGDDAPAPAKGRHLSYLDIVTAIVVGTAGVATSWSGYQGALWSGVQSAHYTTSNALRVQSAETAGAAAARTSAEVLLFTQWLNAYAQGDARLASFYRDRFPADLSQAFDAWIALAPLKGSGPPNTPFHLPQYEPADGREAEALLQEADRVFAEGQRANDTSDRYIRATVLFASAMYFSGMVQVFGARTLRVLLLAIAVLASALGVWSVASLPVLTE